MELQRAGDDRGMRDTRLSLNRNRSDCLDFKLRMSDRETGTEESVRCTVVMWLPCPCAVSIFRSKLLTVFVIPFRVTELDLGNVRVLCLLRCQSTYIHVFASSAHYT